MEIKYLKRLQKHNSSYNNRSLFYNFIGLIIVTSCVSNKSIISVNDNKYFKESPSIVKYQNKYYLRFVYSNETNTHYMTCESEIKNDSLICYIPTTTSTGNRRDKTQLQEIIDPKFILIIKSDNVYWEEPDANFIKMLIEELNEEEIELVPKIDNEN